MDIYARITSIAWPHSNNRDQCKVEISSWTSLVFCSKKYSKNFDIDSKDVHDHCSDSITT